MLCKIANAAPCCRKASVGRLRPANRGYLAFDFSLFPDVPKQRHDVKIYFTYLVFYLSSLDLVSLSVRSPGFLMPAAVLDRPPHS